MGVLFDGSISGDGTDNFGPSSIYYATVRFTTIPDFARRLADPTADRYLRLGFISWLTDIDIGDGTVRDYYKPPIWCDFVSNWLTPDPDFAAGAFNLWFAHGVRWHIESGGEAWLHIYGP